MAGVVSQDVIQVCVKSADVNSDERCTCRLHSAGCLEIEFLGLHWIIVAVNGQAPHKADGRAAYNDGVQPSPRFGPADQCPVQPRDVQEYTSHVKVAFVLNPNSK